MFYSQFGQDKFVVEHVFKGFAGGTFVDVGAHDGVTINNTLHLARELGRHGVNIEPLSDVFEKLQANRPNDINLNIAIGSVDGEAEFIVNSGYTEMLSGLAATYDARHHQRLENELAVMGGASRRQMVQVRRLETVFDELKIDHVHYLSIDVEGGEIEVIKSINFNKVIIDLIAFENNYPDVGSEIITYLEYHGYQVIRNEADVFMLLNISQFTE